MYFKFINRFIGGISRDITKESLEKTFQNYGKLLDIDYPPVKRGNKLAHCFVNYSTIEEAKYVLYKYN